MAMPMSIVVKIVVAYSPALVSGVLTTNTCIITIIIEYQSTAVKHVHIIDL